MNWAARSSGYGQGAIKRNDVERNKDKAFEWSDAFKQRQQQSVFDRLGGASTRAKQAVAERDVVAKPRDVAKRTTVAKRDISPVKPLQRDSSPVKPLQRDISPVKPLQQPKN